MCGIAGLLHKNAEAIRMDAIKRMTDVIAHRGPDGDGQWISPNGHVGLGHRRLSIIDLSTGGDQPMHYADKRYTITFNGEIYNYIELKQKLISKGYTFQSTSDTEVLLALYDAEKEGCLTSLDGMFAFAIWDEKEQTLFFARDRFGEKPFHYAFTPEKYFVFGSEMKSLWAYGIPRVRNNKMLYRYLVYNEIMNEEDLAETFFDGILRLKPAHYGILHFPSFKLKIKQYWDINYRQVNDEITEREAKEKFRDLFLTSVGRRLRSDVPVGSSLSGGLDSSLIVCAINHLQQDKGGSQHTFSARFPGFKKDEGVYMDKVIAQTNANAHFVYPDAEHFFENMSTITWHQEEPFGSASISAQNAVMKLAKEKNITVLLDGQGADEILAGYHIYYYSFFHELRSGDRSTYKAQLEKYHRLQAGNNINGLSYQGDLKSWVKSKFPAALLKLIKNKRQQLAAIRSPFISRDFIAEYAVEESRMLQTNIHLNHSLYNSTTGAGLQELLRYADRNSMQYSREVRLPFLSHELVTFLFTLPARYKIFDGWTKYLMRIAFEDILPQDITWRKDKIGYEPPQQSWMDATAVKAQINDYKDGFIREKILDASMTNINTDIASSLSDDPGKNWRILQAGLIFNK
ncbi:asparagine synthase (glutamine-hydrolyzing) [Chitinophaga nivalis]|uniref:asparagine synthase (glutamine-hydrolyzing) n=1 Tax=Chitinophaga nivalis TaxID=2991709 RepID=A0ABT3IWZ4_9BACT|nr:asparagine synthase (glutamine-hydrolyzing) [Chitinophaga nivalis]MCW3462079.1 asparagine synthase (glutamine-hydrolyzing) [Chitinophaga nivalis]MCW3488229.1 asparagine synthase (glutamine-hydrolyzing) [Chitinophaga nivalis]